MRTNIISDTSCLILLDRINTLDVLAFLYKEIVITSAIAREYAKDLPDWIRVQDPLNTNTVNSFETFVDAGEASAIALAMELENCLLILDDLQGRNLALSLGLDITGTLGILLEARLSGYFKELKPVLDRIRLETNFRISPELVKKTLIKAREL